VAELSPRPVVVAIGAHGARSTQVPFMSFQDRPDQAREESDGVFPWLVVIAAALAVLVALEFAGRYGAAFVLT
jgi:hypothetical protein